MYPSNTGAGGSAARNGADIAEMDLVRARGPGRPLAAPPAPPAHAQSLAYPLYFASRGSGKLATPSGREAYTTAAKVFISGLGADE